MLRLIIVPLDFTRKVLNCQGMASELKHYLETHNRVGASLVKMGQYKDKEQ